MTGEPCRCPCRWQTVGQLLRRGLVYVHILTRAAHDCWTSSANTPQHQACRTRLFWRYGGLGVQDYPKTPNVSTQDFEKP